MNTAAWQPPSRLVSLDSGTSETVEAEETARRALQALAAEPGAVLYRPSESDRKVIGFLPVEVPVIAVLPDLPKLLREAAEHGVVHAALSRLAGNGIGTWWRLAMATLRHTRRIAAQDLIGLIPVLIELERAALAGRTLSGVAVAAPLTDLLLAAGHRECFAHVATFLRTRVGTHAGFETNNLGHLLSRLGAWGVAPDFVIGPVNPRGFRMKPSGQEVLEAVRTSRIPVIAAEVTAAGTLPFLDGAAFARQSGATGVVLALDELASAV